MNAVHFFFLKLTAEIAKNAEGKLCPNKFKRSFLSFFVLFSAYSAFSAVKKFKKAV